MVLTSQYHLKRTQFNYSYPYQYLALKKMIDVHYLFSFFSYSQTHYFQIYLFKLLHFKTNKRFLSLKSFLLFNIAILNSFALRGRFANELTDARTNLRMHEHFGRIYGRTTEVRTDGRRTNGRTTGEFFAEFPPNFPPQQDFTTNNSSKLSPLLGFSVLYLHR